MERLNGTMLFIFIFAVITVSSAAILLVSGFDPFGREALGWLVPFVFTVVGLTKYTVSR